MFDAAPLIESVKVDTHFFLNEVKQFDASQGDYRPTPEMFSVSEQVRHVAQTIDWFREAGWGAGFNMDFEAAEKKVRVPGTLGEAVAELKAATDRMVETLGQQSPEQLAELLPDNPILGPMPKVVLVSCCKDHTAHHRGALSVYLRLLGKTPKMPYES